MSGPPRSPPRSGRGSGLRRSPPPRQMSTNSFARTSNAQRPKDFKKLLGQEYDSKAAQDHQEVTKRSKVLKDGFRAPIDEYGAYHDPDDVGVLKLYGKHVEMDLEAEGKRPESKDNEEVYIQQDGSLSELPLKDIHLYLDVKHCIFTVGEDTELYFSLYSVKEDKYLTEEYVVKLTPQGAPSIGLGAAMHCVFRGLERSDFENELYLVCRIYRQGSLIWDANNVKRQKNSKTVTLRRPYGCSVISISDEDTISSLLTCNEHTPPNAEIFVPGQEVAFTTLPEVIIKNSASLEKAQKAIGIATGFQLFWGDIEEVKQQIENVEFLAICDKLYVQNFDNDDRHELYVTLGEGEFAQGRKTAQRNVQAVMKLCVASDRPVADCISRGKGPMSNLMSDWRSTVYYHNNTPQVYERASIRIPEERSILANCHIYLEFLHCSRSDKEQPQPFAFGFLPLMDFEKGALITNKRHLLYPYKYKKGDMSCYTKSQAFGYSPNSKLEKLSTKQTFTVETYLSSCKATQDPDLYRFLTWRTLSAGDLLPVLNNITKKPTASIAHLLGEIMATIFEILASTEDRAYHNAVFSVLVSILADISHTAKEFSPLLQRYIKGPFNSPSAHVVLMKFFSSYLGWMNSEAAECKTPPEEFKTLSNTIKAMKFIFQFTLKSFQLHYQLPNPTTTRERFFASLDSIFQGINRMMARSEPAWVIAIHGFSIKHFLNVLDYLTDVYTSEELDVIVCAFIENVTFDKSNINIDKLLMIRNFLNHTAIAKKDVLNISLPVIVRQMKIHISQTLEEQILCVSIVANILPLLDEEFCLMGGPDPRLNAKTDENQIDHHNWNDGVVGGVDATAASREACLASLAELVPYIFETLDTVRCSPAEQVERAMIVISRQREKTRPSYMQIQQDLECTLFGLLDMLADYPDVGPDLESNGYTMSPEYYQDLDQPPPPPTPPPYSTQTQLNGNGYGLERTQTAPVHGTQPRGEKFRQFSTSSRFDRAMKVLYRYMDGSHAHALKTCMDVCTHLVNETLFPQDWVQLRMIEIQTAIRILLWSSRHLTEHYLESATYDHTVWVSYMTLAVTILRNKNMQLGQMQDARRNLVLHRYGDLRMLIALELQSIWSYLGEQKIRFLEVLVEPVIFMAQSEIIEVQHLAQTMYFDMLLQEFDSNGNFERVEYYTIDTVDILTSQHGANRMVLDKYKDFFTRQLHEHFAQHERLAEAGENFGLALTELFDHLIALKSLPQTRAYEDERTIATLKLMAYLRRTGKKNMHVRYMEYIASLHGDLDNAVERGNALLYHRETLGWTNEELEAVGKLPKEKEWQRNIRLYRLAVVSFDEGECWERSIKICQELAEVFEKRTFEISQLAAILHQQAEYWVKVISQDRIFRTCFLVGYFGKSFPAVLRGKKFVYRSGRGLQPESVAEFTNRIKAKFPEARVVNSTEEVPQDVVNSENEDPFIQITTLSPSSEEEMESLPNKWRSINAPQKLINYRINNEIKVFSYVRASKKHAKSTRKSVNEFAEMWVEKVFVVSENTIPCLQRRVPVVEEKVRLMGPLEFAVNNIRDKTDGISQIIASITRKRSGEQVISLANMLPELEETKHKHEEKVDVGPLTMQLQGVIDAAVQGGVNKYKEAFFEGSYLAEHPDHQRFVDPFRIAIRDQVNVLDQGLTIYGKHCPDDLKPHYEHLCSYFDQMQDFLRKTNLIAEAHDTAKSILSL